MCEKCDAMLAKLSPEKREEALRQREEFFKARTEALTKLVKFTNDFADSHGELGAPAVTAAMALALGGLLGRVPAEIREIVVMSCMHMICSAMNVVGEKDGVHFEVATIPINRPEIQEEFQVKPPTMH